jgi:DNA-nicking Smr family endonuclease
VKNPPRKGRVFCRQIFPAAENATMPTEDSSEPVAIPITGELDLHTFRPNEATRLLDDYFAECRKRGIRRVRVVHGKGTGTLRATVLAHLRWSPSVVGFTQGDETSGGWGATMVTLKD